MPEPQSWESDEELKTLSPVGEGLQYNLQVFDHSLRGEGFDYIMVASVYHLLLVSSLFLFMYLMFLIGSRLFLGFSAVRCDLGVLINGDKLKVLLLYHFFPFLYINHFLRISIS